MPEQVLKFQPDRALYLRGFDGRGAAAALHSATADGFTVSGVFRDPSDFAVLVIYDADDFFGHPRIKYLPDFSLAGMVLEYDVHYSGLAPLDTVWFPTIDNTYLDVTLADGSSAQIPLITCATAVGNGPVAATAKFPITLASVVAGDTLRLWFENVSWNYTIGGGETAEGIAAELATQINATDWPTIGGTFSLSAATSGATLVVTASPAGSDANVIRMYSVASAPSRFSTSSVAQLSTGSSDVAWHVKLDFSALGIDSVRQMWLTFAPALADSGPYETTEWDAVFTNWGITADPNNISALQVAGPGSVRIEETDVWCSYSGSSWQSTNVGWFSKGFAQVATALGDSVTVEYICQFPHDLWLGTSLGTGGGTFAVSVDGVTQPSLDMYLDSTDAIATRRKLASGVTAGKHTVTLTVAASNPAAQGSNCTFDFLEAVVASDVPDAPGSWTDRSPAIDYDTNHGYQLAPARLLWMFDKLGFQGPMNEYVGVFWWNQRKLTGQVWPSITVTFAGTFAAGDEIFLTIGDTTIGKTVFDGETLATIAAHFAFFINETFTGVWAMAEQSLVITARAVGAAYQFSFSASTDSSGGVVNWAGSLETGGVAGTWEIDPSQSPALNYAAVCWHQDLFAQVQARGNTVVSSLSMELVDTPDDPDRGRVWVARFPDNTPVLTATGFGSLNSAQCVPMAPEFLAYQQQAFLHLAELQAAAGLVPELQLGEFLWWYFPDSSGMAYYDSVTSASAQSSLGRPLVLFTSPDDDPSKNNFADASFLANTLNSHVAQIVSYVQAVYPNAIFEILFPYDVNGPTVTPITKVGGKLNAFVNFPGVWASAATAPFQRFKLEQLAFGTTDRNMDLVKAGFARIRSLAWPVSLTRYLYPIDNGGVPQWREYTLAKQAGFSSLTPFAMDHVCLLNWELEPPAADVTAQIL